MKNRPEHLLKRNIDGVSTIWHTPSKGYHTRKYYVDPQPDADQSLPLRVNFVHEEYCFENYYRRREQSEVFSIELVLEGSMFFSQEGREYQVKSGEIFLVHLDRENEFMTGPEKGCHRLACSLVGPSLRSLLHSTGLHEHDVVIPNNSSRIEQLIRKCIDEFKEKRPLFRFRASTICYELLLALSADLHQEANSELIKLTTRFMERHLSRRFSLPQLAKHIGSSRSTLSRIFRDQLQQSPINYFLELKMETAKSLLKNTNLRIQEIARQVGYENPLYFSTEFKKRTGMSPREFRKSL